MPFEAIQTICPEGKVVTACHHGLYITESYRRYAFGEYSERPLTALVSRNKTNAEADHKDALWALRNGGVLA